MQPIQTYYNMVEDIIRNLGVDPAICRGEIAGQWNLKRGSANIWVDVWQTKDQQGNLQDYGYIQVMAPVCEVPVNNQHLFTKELLEINHNLYGVSFTIFKEWAYIKSIRELDGLDQNEAQAMFNRIGSYADEYDDRLKQKYGIVPAGQRV
ncbi:MAG: YbjN domain-containing protein [Bacteroidia bacterium]|nr:YbjN domain-containing protein [Bacteroidia bacterium]